MFYGHNFIAHVRVHHKKVSTPDDPQSSRLGESVFQYQIRVAYETMAEVWRFENARLKQQGEDKWWQILIYNRFISFTVGQVLYECLVGFFFGKRALCFNLLVSYLTFAMFESVNYLEHYGLQRKLMPGTTDIYESVNIKHSWNAPQVVTNYLLFKLQRHSDHHANSYKPY